MEALKINVLGIPSVYKDNEKILFPFKKVEALFYYLIVKTEATRDELAGLLWPEEEEKVAKKNIRNALYMLKKAFNMEVIVSPKKYFVTLNQELNFKIDLDIFLKSEDMSTEVYRGEFLKGFVLKDGVDFENWVYKMRCMYEDMYIQKLNNKLKTSIINNDFNASEKYVRRLLEIDEYNEENYRNLMRVLDKQGNYNKAIDEYRNLVTLLDQEMGVLPDIETQRVYEEILEKRKFMNNVDKNNRDFFYGRSNELQILKDIYTNFQREIDYKSILIIGEAGIGKTKIKDKFIELINTNSIYLFQCDCYQAEEKYVLKPWHLIFSQVAEIVKNENIKIPLVWKTILTSAFSVFALTFNSKEDIHLGNYVGITIEKLEEVVLDLFYELSKIKKVVLVCDDIQWMDEESLMFLRGILLKQQKNNIIFIGACRDENNDKIEKFTTELIKYEKLEKIHLKRFNKIEIKEFVKEALPNFSFSNELNDQIFNETEGNTFFLVEYLNSIKEKTVMDINSSKVQDIVRSRFYGISEKSRKVLNIISLFFDGAPFDILKLLSEKDEAEILDILEELQNKNIIKEYCRGSEDGFIFTHHKLREYVYFNLGEARKRFFHNKIALILEKRLKNDNSDILLYSKLIYHFSNSNNKLKALEYDIKNAYIYFDFNHELFPIFIQDKTIGYSNLLLNKVKDIQVLQDIEERMGSIQNIEEEELSKFKIAFFHLKGRYLIREGNYEEGKANIKYMLELALKNNEVDYRLKGYRQMIYYGIQANDIETMKLYMESSLKLAAELDEKSEIGILMRLKGLNEIMSGEYHKAEGHLKESIEVLESISINPQRYLINIAAAYNYLGDIRRYQMEFNNAINYYNKALDICKGEKTISCISLFYTNAGQAAFEMGNYSYAANYFNEALHSYKEFGLPWGRAIAEAYMSLIYVQQGNYIEALNCIKTSDSFGEKIKSPSELGIIYWAKAVIKFEMKKNKELETVFYNYLNKNIEEYCYMGIELLKKTKNSYELNNLMIIE